MVVWKCGLLGATELCAVCSPEVVVNGKFCRCFCGHFSGHHVHNTIVFGKAPRKETRDHTPK